MSNLDLSGFRIRSVGRDGKHTDANNISTSFLNNPQLLANTYEIFANRYLAQNNSMYGTILKNREVKYLDSLTFEYKVVLPNVKPAVLLENLEKDKTEVGRYGTTFKLKLDKNVYSVNDILDDGSFPNKRWSVLVLKEPVPHGNGYVYEVKLVDQDPNLFMKPSSLEVGHLWGRQGSLSGEAGNTGGSPEMPTYGLLQGGLNKVAVADKVTDLSVLLKPGNGGSNIYEMRIPYIMRNGTVGYKNTWAEAKQVALIEHLHTSIDNTILWGSANGTLQDINGQPLISSPGLWKQLYERAPKWEYRKFNIDVFQDNILHIIKNRTDLSGSGRIVFYTGYEGFKAFNKAITEDITRRMRFDTNDKFITSTTSDISQKAFRYGGNFTSFVSDYGPIIDIVHGKFLDDNGTNRQLTSNGISVSSGTFICTDVAPETSNFNNIEVYSLKNGRAWGIEQGLYGFNGAQNGGQVSNLTDASQIRYVEYTGVQVLDPTRCLIVHPVI